MAPTHITLRTNVTDFDTLLDSVIDEARIPVEVNIGKLVEFLVEGVSQEVRPLAAQQCTVFLEQICEAGDEANFIREYLADMLTHTVEAASLRKALSVWTHQKLPIAPLEMHASLEVVTSWAEATAAALDTPYITKLVVGVMLRHCYWPQSEQKLRKLFLSLQ